VNPQKRAAYDRFGHAAFGPGSGAGPVDRRGFHDPFEIFRDVFGGGAGGGGIFDDFIEQAFGGGGRSSRGGGQRGNDLRL